ncbi:MAG: hypothetical protein ACLR5B_11415 [Blautia sp.]
MSANLLSAARTGAVPAVASKYLARKDSEVISMIGCGPINQSCLRHILSQMPKIKVICFDLLQKRRKAVQNGSLKLSPGRSCFHRSSVHFITV